MSMKQKRCPDFSVHAINQWFTSNRWMPHCVQKTAAVKLDNALWNINKEMLYLLLMVSETWLYHASCRFRRTFHIQRRAAFVEEASLAACSSVHHRPASPVCHCRF